MARIVGSEQWICAYRFGVEQSNKIRGCDDYCRNEGNSTSPRSEKLVYSSTNELIARIKLLQKFSTDKMELFGWILDESVPSVTATSDLDSDGKCKYEGRIDSTSNTPPTGTNTWRVYSDGSWADISVTLTENNECVTSTSPSVDGTDEKEDEEEEIILLLFVIVIVSFPVKALASTLETFVEDCSSISRALRVRFLEPVITIF